MLPWGVSTDPKRKRTLRALAWTQVLLTVSGNKAWMSVDEIRERNNLGPVESPDELNPPAPVPVVVGGANDGGQQG